MRLLFAVLVFLTASSNLLADPRVGVILPLSGDFAYFGEEFRQGFETALKEAKSIGTKIPEIIFEDDQCSAKESVAAFKHLLDVEKASLIIGPACSTCINSLAPIARKQSTPVIFLLDTGRKVAELPDPLYSFGFDPPKMARLLAADAYKNNFRKIGIVTEEEEYSNLISDEFTAAFKKLGGSVAATEVIPVNSPDLRSVLAKVLSKKPDAIFFSSAYQAGTFLKQLRLLNGLIQVYGNDTMCVADTVAVAGNSANGARCGNVVLDENKPKIAAFRAALQKAYGRSPSSLFYAALGHDAFFLMLKELNIPCSPSMLTGIEKRRADGMYDIEPSVLEIEHGQIKTVGR